MENQRVVLEIFLDNGSSSRLSQVDVANAKSIIKVTFDAIKGEDRKYKREAYVKMEERLKDAVGVFKEVQKAGQKAVKAQLPGKGNAPARESQYKQLIPKWKHEVYDPIFKDYEKQRFFGTMTLGLLLSEIRINLFAAKPPMEMGYIAENNVTLISVGDKFGFGGVPVANIYKQEGRFEKIYDGLGALPDVFKHRENSRHYVRDRYGVFIPRFLIRNLSKHDMNLLTAGLQSRDGRSFATKARNSEARDFQEKDFIEAVVRHLRAAQQGGSFFISATSTSKHIYGSTGENFYTPSHGQVLLDAAIIPQDDLVDVHSPQAMSRMLNMKKYDWTLEFSETDASYQTMAAARDTIRTREVVVHGSIPQQAIAKIRSETLNHKAWVTPTCYAPGGIAVDPSMDARLPTFTT